MTLEEAAKVLGVDINEELEALGEDPNGQRGVTLAIAFRDHPQGGAEKLADLIRQVGALLGFNVREDIEEVIPNLDWWLDDDSPATGPVVIAAAM